MKFYQNCDKAYWLDIIHEHRNLFPEYNTYTKRSSVRGMEHMWFKIDSSGNWGALDERNESITWLQGNHHAYMREAARSLNLKYVPKSIKDANYPDFKTWLEKVWEFISKSKDKAKFKAKAKEANRRTAQAIEFMNFRGEMEGTADKYGFTPTTNLSYYAKEQGFKTWNEYWQKQGRDSVEFKKGGLTITGDVQRSGNKLTIQGIPVDKVREVLEAAFRVINGGEVR